MFFFRGIFMIFFVKLTVVTSGIAYFVTCTPQLSQALSQKRLHVSNARKYEALGTDHTHKITSQPITLGYMETDKNHNHKMFSHRHDQFAGHWE